MSDRLKPYSLDNLFRKGGLKFQQGRQPEAMTLLKQILVADNAHPDVNHLLGVFLGQGG
jgi:hypothetical protein